MSLATQRLSNKPKTSDLVLEHGQHVGLRFVLDEVTTGVTQEQRQRTDDLATRRWPRAATRHVVQSLPHRRMVSRAAVLVTIGITIFAVFAASAQAAVKDPRKCSYGADRRADCAHYAAWLTSRRILGAKIGETLWQGQLTCTAAGSLLKWRCRFDQQHPQLPPKGYVAVTYRATSTGWHVYTSIVATP